MRIEQKWCGIATSSLHHPSGEILPKYKELHNELGENPFFLYNYAAELNYASQYSTLVA